MVSRMECQIHCLLASLNMIPFLVEESLLPRENLGIKKIKTLAFYARVECVGEELIKQKSKRLVWWPIAYNSFFFLSQKKKITNSFSIKDTKHKLLLFSDFILKPKIPNTLEGILMLIHTLEKAFLLTFT